MKKLTLALIALPGLAMAHGAHAPVPDLTHGMTHAGPALGLAIVGTAIGLAALQRWRS